jgi:hypothetical protein
MDGNSDREVRLQRLPTRYSLALRLRDAGVSDAVICTYLEIEPEGLPTLLALAQAKYAAAGIGKRPSTPAPRSAEMG